MQRVAITGSPGTGKSTFARRLAAASTLPLIHLDFYFRDQRHSYYADKGAWRERAYKLTDAKLWIIDGNYSSSIAERLVLADTIFYFNLPTRVAICGIVSRWLNAKHSPRTDMPDSWKEKLTWEFFRYVLGFHRHYRKSFTQLLECNKSKNIVEFTSRRQVNKYLRERT